MIAMKPSDYGLEHDEWRTHQQETIDWALSATKPAILQAPTGSGKTAIARAISAVYPSVALVRTKELQAENYDKGYNYIALYGRGNYNCVYQHAVPGAHADECAFIEEGMTHCPQYSICPYVMQRELAKESPRTVLNYPYWLMTKNKWPAPQSLVCDEAHQLSEITLEWAGCTISNKMRIRYNLPMFPILRSGGSRSILGGGSPVEERARTWLSEVRMILLKQHTVAASKPEDMGARKMARALELLGKKVSATLSALQIGHNEWYIRSGPDAVEDDWGFTARPLTARYHFSQYFMGEWRLYCMSATIGDAETFATELGITDFTSRDVPSIWPAETRPIYALDVPRMGQKSTDTDWQKQADEIANAIKQCPSEWSGIVHVTSKAEASRLGDRLRRRGLTDRVYVAENLPTDAMMRAWRDRLSMRKNSILISWAFWEGYNGLEEKINIVAKLPYPFLGDAYEIERRSYDGKFFLQRTAWRCEQALGRTRRGREVDYDLDGEQRGFVAIADGSWRWIRNYLSPATLESIKTI